MEKGEASGDTLQEHEVAFTRQRSRAQILCLVALVVVVIVLMATAIGVAAGLGVARSDGVDEGEQLLVTGDDLSVPVMMMLGDPNCPVHPSPSPLPSPLPDEIKSAISTVEDQLTNLLNTDTLPGLTAGITYRDQQLWSKGLGVTSKEVGGCTPNTTTIYRIASVSKVFTALMVYQMYDRGLIRSLDDPLKLFCPDFHIDNPYTADDVTLRQIMSYMSGLPREAPCGEVLQPAVNLCPHNTSVILERLSSQSIILPPWSKPSYSNLAFGLLGHCLVPHFYPNMTYEEYIEQNILQPLGMSSTGFNYTDSVLERLATGYMSDGSPEPVYDVGWWGPAGQMYSTIQDLNKFATFFYSVGGVQRTEDPVSPEVLSPTVRRLMILPTYTNRDQQTGMGTSWEIRFQNNYTVNMKGGNLRGYATLFSFIPDLHLGLNILFSGTADEFSVAQEAYDTLIPAFVKTLTGPVAYPLPPNVTVYTGAYTSGDSSAHVLLHKNNLVVAGTTLSGVYLAYREPFRFQIELPEDSYPCLSSELLALAHTWVYFDEPVDSSGLASGFALPGFLSSFQFRRR